MKKIIPLLCLFLLASCASETSSSLSSDSFGEEASSSALSTEEIENPPSSSDNHLSSDETVSSEQTSSFDSASKEDPSSEIGSSQDPLVLKGSIASILKEAKTALEGSLPNDKGYVFTDIPVDLTGRVYFYGDMVTTQAGSGNQYSAFAVDETGYLYCDIDLATYSGNPKKYAGTENQYFRIQGTLSSFKGTPHVQVRSFDFIQNPTMSIGVDDIQNLSSSIQNMGDVYSYIADMPINLKGCGFGDIASFTGKYIAEMDDSVLLFSDGTHLMKVHGNNKISNSFTLNQVYTVYGVMDEYRFAPGMEYLEKVASEETIEDIASATSVTCASTYSWNYKNDTDAHQSNYEGLFGKTYSVTGYVNAYTKNEKKYFVLTDAAYDADFNAYVNAVSAKALFFKNDTENSLYKKADFDSSLLYPYYTSKERVTLQFAPYLWNTSKYFQGYILPGSLEASPASL